MLSSLRKFSETLTAKIFIALIALSFVFWGINDFYKSSYNSALAEIDGDKISFNEFTREYNKIVRNNNIQSQKLAIEKKYSYNCYIKHHIRKTFKDSCKKFRDSYR